jgi:hypothetical protein
MGCFDTGRLSDSGTEKRLRNGPFAENARGWPFVQIQHALERSAPDNLPGVTRGVLKPSAEQQGVQEQRQDGVLGDPRCRKESLEHALEAAHACCMVICISCMHHPSRISCMLNRRGFHKMLPHWQGKVTMYTVQVDILQPYLHCTRVLKKVPEYQYPLYFENFKNRADLACLNRAGKIP